jgi:glycosyltransferase involved in cell wall biosynthesis
MKVLICHNRYRSHSPSGENQAVDSEIVLLRGGGIEVIPMLEESDSIRGGGSLAMVNAALGPLYSPTGVRRFKSLLREERPDVVHLHNVFPLISPAVVGVAKAAGVPIVQTVHNYRHVCANGLHFRDGQPCDDCVRRLVPYPAVLHGCYRGSRVQSAAMTLGQMRHRRTWRMVDLFVARTPFMAHRLLALGLEAKQITVLPSWAPDPGEPTSPGNDFLYLGRLEEAKGVDLLLKAWRSGENHSTRKLRIAGTGPLEGRIRSMARTEDNVDYIGHLDRDAVATAIRQCGVVAVPSLSYEGACPLTVVEAMAYGRPVMVNHGTSIASAVSNDFAWCVKPTADSWRETITTIRQDDVDARGLAARRRYEKTCTPSTALESLVRIYTNIIGESA